MFYLFKYVTSITYLLLVLFWLYIFIFYLIRIKRKTFEDRLLRTLLIILAFDSLRTLFESVYFGVRQASQDGFFNRVIFDFLSLPHIVFIPKIVNLVVSILIIFILIRKIIPQEDARIRKMNQLIHDKDIVIEQIPISVLITDLNGNIEYTNKKFQTLTGYSHEEVVGKNPRILNSGNLNVTDFNELWDTIKADKIWHGNFYNKKKNGEYYWENALIQPIHDSNGNTTHYMAIKEDITEQIKSNNQNEMLLSAIEQTKDTVEILDVEGKIIYVNKAFVEKTGYSKEDVLGKTPVDVFKSDLHYNEVVEKEVWNTLSNGNSWKGRFTNKNKDGSFIVEDVTSTPVFNDAGEIISYTSVKRDVTQSLLEEKEKKKILDQLHQSQKLESVGQLAGGIAHDFNNALGGIMSAAQLLNNPDRKLDERGLKYVKMILQSSKRAADLTTKLLSFSRRSRSEYINLHLLQILKESVSILRQTLDRSINIEMSDESENDMIVGDISGLQNTILNLGINASHAIETKGNISFSLYNKKLDTDFCKASSFNILPGNYSVLEVKDNGSGIEKEHLDKIFEPFFTTKEEGKGTGLGLSSVMRTVIDHNGLLEVNSDPGKGSVFRIFIPTAKDHIEPENKTELLINGSGSILFVDDEFANRITAQDILTSLGYKVLLAENGEEAVDLYTMNRDKIDLVILDLIMPVMNGEEAFYKLREINPQCLILIISGNVGDIDINDLLNRGLDGFLNKPYRMHELSKMIDDVIKSR